MLHLEIITPDRAVYEGDVDAVALPTTAGEIVVLPHHEPMITTVAPGTVVVRVDGVEHAFAVAKGVIEIDGKSARVLTDIADPADTLDEAAIEAAKQRAEDLMKNKRHDEEAFAEAVGLLERELARLKTVRRRRPPRSL